MSKKKLNKENKTILVYISITLTIVLSAWLANYFLLKDLTPEKRGTFGDMFGSVNAIFSGLAFGGVIITILLQKKELKLQRKELRETRKEFHIQNKTLKLQRFENTFFQLLNLHNEIVTKVQITKSIGHSKFQVFQGRAAFKIYVEHFFDTLMTIPKEEIENAYKRIYLHLSESYIEFYNNKGGLDLSNYYRNLYHIFKFVHKTEFLTNDEKQFYSNLVRAQLSNNELLLILYNSLVGGFGKPKFLFLIQQYDILQNFDFTKIKQFSIHEDIFRTECSSVTNPFTSVK